MIANSLNFSLKIHSAIVKIETAFPVYDHGASSRSFKIDPDWIFTDTSFIRVRLCLYHDPMFDRFRSFLSRSKFELQTHILCQYKMFIINKTEKRNKNWIICHVFGSCQYWVIFNILKMCVGCSDGVDLMISYFVKTNREPIRIENFCNFLKNYYLLKNSSPSSSL